MKVFTIFEIFLKIFSSKANKKQLLEQKHRIETLFLIKATDTRETF